MNQDRNYCKAFIMKATPLFQGSIHSVAAPLIIEGDFPSLGGAPRVPVF